MEFVLQWLRSACQCISFVLLNCSVSVCFAASSTEASVEIIRSRGHERLIVMVAHRLDAKWREPVNGQQPAGVWMSVSSGACAAAVGYTGTWALGAPEPTERSRQMILRDGAKEFYGLTPMSEGCQWLPTASVDLTLSFPAQKRALSRTTRVVEVFAPTEEQDKNPVGASVVWIHGVQWLALFNRSNVPLALGSPDLAPIGEPELDFALRGGEVALFYSPSLTFCSTHDKFVIASFHDDGSYRLRQVSLSPANRDLLTSIRKGYASASTAGAFPEHCGVP
jgi:hypothetical protein